VKKSLVSLLSAVVLLTALTGCKATQQVAKADTVTVAKTAQVGLTDEQKNDIKKFSSFASNYKRQNKHRDVINNIDKVMAIDPEFTEAKNILLYWKGTAYEELKNLDSAKIMFEQFTKVNPRHTGVLLKLEYMYYSDNKLEQAIDANKMLIELDSSKVNPEPYKKIGNYYMTLAGEENEKTAMEFYEEYMDIVADSLKDASIDNVLNNLVNKYRNIEEQITRYAKVLESNPADQKAMEKLSLLYMKNNDNKKAEEYALKVLDKDSENLKVIKRLVKIYTNNPAKGIVYNQKAMKLEPKNEAYNINLARFYKEQKNYAAARSNCVEALNKNPRNKSVYRVWADLYTDAVSTCAKDVDYQDKLVYVIAYGIYEKAGNTRTYNSMKESGQVPSKADKFQSKGVTRPSRGCYGWISNDWEEVRYIDQYLKSL